MCDSVLIGAHSHTHKASTHDAVVLIDATVMCVMKKCAELLLVASGGDTQVRLDADFVLLFVTWSQSPLAHPRRPQ